MLLEDKINALLLDEPEYIDTTSDIFIKEISKEGKVQTEVMVMADILYYLLNLNFVHDNLNLEIYKYLKHLKDIIIPVNTSVDYIPVIELPSVPVITVDVTGDIDFGIVQVGNSVIRSFSFEATSTFDKVLVTSNNEFTLSNDPNGPFTQQLQYFPTPLSGILTTSTVYVKYTPINTGSDTDSITISVLNAGIGTVTIGLLGQGISSTLGATPSTLAFPITRVNIQSAPLSFSVNGSLLASDVVITAPTCYKVSLILGSYTQSVTLSPDINGNLASTTIYVVFTPLGSISYPGNITIQNTELAATPITLTGIGTQIQLDVTPIEVDLGDVFIGDPISFPYPSFNITGVELTSDVTITVPNIISDYIIWYSYTDDTGLQHGSSVSFSISPINGIIDMDINILFTAINVIGNISLPIIVSTTGVASQTILLKANLVTAVLALTPATIDFGSVIVNETSEIQVRLTGDGLPPQLVISCNNDSRFTFSITSKSDPSTSYLTFAYFATNTGSIDMILYVQGKPTGSNTFTNTLSAGTVNTPGFSSANTSADMQIIGIISTLVAAPDNMSFPNTNTGSSSTYISFNLIGTNLSGNTTITPPTGYTVCKTSGGTYSSSISYTDVEIEAGVTTYVKFNPIATTTYTGNIVINNLLVSETISLSGTGISAGIPETLISLVADGSHLDSFSSYASQVFYNNTTIYEITYIAFGYVGASVPASTATIEIRDNSTNTLLHTENVSGTAAGGLKIVSLSAPIAVTSGQALKIKIIRLTGNWYLNRPTVDYSTLSVIDGVPFVHSFAMVITGNKH